MRHVLHKFPFEFVLHIEICEPEPKYNFSRDSPKKTPKAL